MNKAFSKYGKQPWHKIEPRRYKSRRALRVLFASGMSAQVASQLSQINSAVASTPTQKARKAAAIASAVIKGQIAIFESMKSNHGIR